MNDGVSVIERYTGSPIYQISEQHEGVIALVILLGLGLIVVRLLARWGHGRSQAIVDRFRALLATERLLAGVILVAAVANLGMGLGQESVAGLWLILVGVGEVIVVRHLVKGRAWRRFASRLLVVSLVANLGLLVAGITLDQIGLMTALLEATGLAVVLRGVERTRLRTRWASLVVVGAIGLTTLAGWGGAVVAGAGGERLGDTPLPGVLLPVGEDRAPTEAESAEAQRILEATTVGIAKYQDLEVAAAAGYQVDQIVGSQVHAENPAFKSDGITLDPQRPETLVYEPGPDGPILLGALYEMEEIGLSGPAFGGPLTVWHAHDNICFSALMPSLAGFESPLGGCGMAAISVPITNEMIHVWTLPGIENAYGEIDDAWLTDYLEQQDPAS